MGLKDKKLFSTEVKEPDCRGLIFRAHINSYISSHKSIEVRKSLRLLKRKSCKGCKHCEWILEFIQEDIFEFDGEDYIGKIENGKMYKLEIRWHPGPYEYPADGDMEILIRQYEERKPNCTKIFDHYNPCPDCGSQLKSISSGGVRCPNKNCNYWFCF